ncbi:hypothetical protein ACHHYP_04178 [Achlya hypogyna]|uniref:Uncharacterized protein n=1 Tax=Achlya hypogyna TaxID=1202772 RepID=A0A1V9Z1S0_ACHHY|nr:hypothetical protein ACHHYP_04178 [Achlya hypogyna]
MAQTTTGVGQWTRDEHRRYLRAIQLYPQGPWKSVADYIGTRTARQTQTHAQKHREKLLRRKRGLLRKRATSDEWLDDYDNTSPKSVQMRSPVPDTAYRGAMAPPIAVQAPPYQPQYDTALASDDVLSLPPYPRTFAPSNEKFTQPHACYSYQQLHQEPYPNAYYQQPAPMSYGHQSVHAPPYNLQPHDPPVHALPLDEMLLEYFGDDIRRHGAPATFQG